MCALLHPYRGHNVTVCAPVPSGEKLKTFGLDACGDVSCRYIICWGPVWRVLPCITGDSKDISVDTASTNQWSADFILSTYKTNPNKILNFRPGFRKEKCLFFLAINQWRRNVSKGNTSPYLYLVPIQTALSGKNQENVSAMLTSLASYLCLRNLSIWVSGIWKENFINCCYIL